MAKSPKSYRGGGLEGWYSKPTADQVREEQKKQKAANKAMEEEIQKREIEQNAKIKENPLHRIR